MPDRNTMNGKPVLEIPSKTVINFKSGFEHKLLCDGPTFTMGDACPYSCAFCYVPSVMNQRLFMLKEAGTIPKDTQHVNVVLRRKNALGVLANQLRGRRWKPEDSGKVIYSSPLTDCAANMDLARETLAACLIILRESPWDIRLLSKSTFLPVIAKGIADTFSENDRLRIVYGVSTGTFDDKLAAAFEEGCPKVSKRIESLARLRDLGCRTFGMICPSLPQLDYFAFAQEAHESLSDLVTEHVWAEAINVRGESMVRTCASLSNAGFLAEAGMLQTVSCDSLAWERYARKTFLAHKEMRWGDFRPKEPRLRFLQYVNDANMEWWNAAVPEGAVIL